MATELVKATVAMPATTEVQKALPAIVERAGAAGRFAWEEFFPSARQLVREPGATA